jgi:hypothetical protein
MVQAMHFHLLMRSNEAASTSPLNTLMSESGDYHSLNQHLDLNANNGLTIIWLIERSLNEVSHFLQRMSYLAKNAAQSDCLDSERSLLAREYTILLNEIDHYAQTTCFNRIRLTSGETDTITIKLGSHYINSPHMKITLSNLSGWGLNLADISLETIEEAATAVEKLDQAREILLKIKTQLEIDKLTIETSFKD